MDAALIARLRAEASLDALGNAIAWDERPRSGALPALTLTLIAPGNDYTHGGADGLDFAWVQADLWGVDAEQLVVLSAALTEVFEGSDDVAGVRFHAGFREGGRSFAPEDLPGGVKVHRRMNEYRFYWETL